MPEESNLQEVLDAVEGLKKENNSIIEYIKSNDKNKKSNQKLFDLLSDKPDVQDRNESLSDNIDELNKTLKGLPKSLIVEGEGKSFNFLDLLPVLAGVLALSYVTGSSNDSKGGGEGDKTSLENDMDRFNDNLKNFVFDNHVGRTLLLEPVSKRLLTKINNPIVKAIKKSNLKEKNLKNLEKANTKKLEDALLKEEKSWKNLEDFDNLNITNRDLRETLESEAYRRQGYSDALKDIKTEAAQVGEKAALDAAKATESVITKRMVKRIAGIIPFADILLRSWFAKIRAEEGDTEGATEEGIGAVLSGVSSATGVIPHPAAQVVSKGAYLGRNALDIHLIGRDIYNLFKAEQILYPGRIKNKNTENDIKLNYSIGAGTADHCINFFINYGFTPIAACGIAGNAFVESTFKSKWDPPKKHFGVFQWNNDRRNISNYSFLRWSRGKDMTNSSIEEQYAFAIWEVRNLPLVQGISNGNYAINYCKTPEEAAEWWEANFERSGGQLLNERKRAARQFYDQYQKSYNASKVESKLSNNSSKVPNPNSIRLINASKAQQQKFNQRFKNIIKSGNPTTNTSQNTNQSVVSVSNPSYNSSNYFGEVTPDIQDQSWYNYQKQTGVTDAFKGVYST